MIQKHREKELKRKYHKISNDLIARELLQRLMAVFDKKDQKTNDAS